jgi:hypothetical protein
MVKDTSNPGGLRFHESEVQMGLPQSHVLPLPKSFQNRSELPFSTSSARSEATTDPILRVYLSNGRRTRWCERISTVTAESSDYGVNLRTVQNLFFEQLLRNFVQQTQISL